jgi:hypothetical protein
VHVVVRAGRTRLLRMKRPARWNEEWRDEQGYRGSLANPMHDEISLPSQRQARNIGRVPYPHSPLTSRIWTAANAVMLAMFAFSVAVQFNDPDPLLWMAIYGVAAIVCGFEMRRMTPLWAAALVAVTALMWSGWIALRVHDVPFGALFAEWEMQDVDVEEAREMYGLAIVGIWMMFIAGVAWARRSRGASR